MSLKTTLLANLRLIEFFETGNEYRVNPFYLRKLADTNNIIYQNGTAQIDWTLVCTFLEPIDPLIKTSTSRKQQYQDVLKGYMQRTAKTTPEPSPSVKDFFTPKQLVVIEAIVNLHVTPLRQELEALRAQVAQLSQDTMFQFGEDEVNSLFSE